MRRPLLLLVDDAPDVGHIAGYLCRRARQDLVVCEDAASAWQYLREADPLPDLLLLDVNLAGRNGLDFFRDLHQTTRLQRIPVALFTQITVPDAVARALEQGIDFVIAKEGLAKPDAWKERTEEILFAAAHRPSACEGGVDSATAAVALRAALQHPTVCRLGPDVAGAVWRCAVRRAALLVAPADSEPVGTLAGIDLPGGGMDATKTLLSVLDAHPRWASPLVDALRYQIECLLGRQAARAAVRVLG